MNTKTIVFFFLSLFVLPFSGWTQTEPEDIAMVSDEFQDSFYESLLQKGIENYDKAIVALEKCLVSQPNNATIHFELGKNYLALKQYENAYQSFQKATQIEPKNRWFWVGIYDLSFQTKNYDRAMAAVQQLILFDERNKDDLIPLYMMTNQSEKALALIKEMDAKYGKSQERTQFKNQILLATKNETSDWKEVGDFKKYLDANDGNQAVQLMNNILVNTQIPNTVKHRVVNEFLIFAFKNPQFESNLEKAISFFDSDKEVNVAQAIGKFYQNKNQTEKAIRFYELALQKEVGAVETNLLLLQAYTTTQQFEKLAQKSAAGIELYPAQAYFYYYFGLANNQLRQFKKAKDTLETGLDFVIDDLDLEINFNLQLAEAYNGLGDFNKKDSFFAQANQLIQKKKK
ncbi:MULTISPECIES: tetratricopeptide repeat protein [Flavobacterium]|uniref:Tetratricopeptide repeat protein n=1 Tax=Flavobacterium keumense TaxID=1306518 RepID=A0ABY8N7T0_9FLAO|nr:MULTISPECIES: tetratricopeptide repeat protein [Flavobacterium]WGK95233.1 tetratricopeptide repeat protein [Flavobacterium keumense]